MVVLQNGIGGKLAMLYGEISLDMQRGKLQYWDVTQSWQYMAPDNVAVAVDSACRPTGYHVFRQPPVQPLAQCGRGLRERAVAHAAVLGESGVQRGQCSIIGFISSALPMLTAGRGHIVQVSFLVVGKVLLQCFSSHVFYPFENLIYGRIFRSNASIKEFR